MEQATFAELEHNLSVGCVLGRCRCRARHGSRCRSGARITERTAAITKLLGRLDTRAFRKLPGAGRAGAAVGVDHREPVALEAARELAERAVILAHVRQGVVAQDEVEARVRECEPRRVRRHEPAAGAEAAVMAAPPHVHRDAPRRCEQTAPDDMVGAEAR